MMSKESERDRVIKKKEGEKDRIIMSREGEEEGGVPNIYGIKN